MATNAAINYLPYLREQAVEKRRSSEVAQQRYNEALREAAEGPATEPCGLPHVDLAVCTLFRNCPHCGRDL